MRTSILAIVAVCGIAAPAFAGFTNIKGGAAGEPGVHAIINFMAGTNHSLSDLNSGAFSRVNDGWDRAFKNGGGPASVAGVWWGGNSLQNPIGTAVHSLGWAPVGTTVNSGNFNALSDDIFSNNLGPVGPVNIFPELSVDPPFHFLVQRQNQNIGSHGALSSNPNLLPNTGVPQNGGTTDRMVTFNLTKAGITSLKLPGQFEADGVTPKTLAVSSVGGKFSYIFFVDSGVDGDYNDYVFIVNNIAAVPLPQGAAMASIGLLGLTCVRRRKTL